MTSSNSTVPKSLERELKNLICKIIDDRSNFNINALFNLLEKNICMLVSLGDPRVGFIVKDILSALGFINRKAEIEANLKKHCGELEQLKQDDDEQKKKYLQDLSYLQKQLEAAQKIFRDILQSVANNTEEKEFKGTYEALFNSAQDEITMVEFTIDALNQKYESSRPNDRKISQISYEINRMLVELKEVSEDGVKQQNKVIDTFVHAYLVEQVGK
jgi:hypothetical protein